MNIWLKGFIILLVLVALAFALEYANLGWTKFFGPKRANIQREIFEEQKSYTHGMAKELAKYYEEYRKAETVGDKAAISEYIKMNFGNFDEKKLTNDTLKAFLIKIRGY